MATAGPAPAFPPTCPTHVSQSHCKENPRPCAAGERAYLHQFNWITQNLLCMKVIQPEPGFQVSPDVLGIPQHAVQRLRAAARPCKRSSDSHARCLASVTGASPPEKNGFLTCKGKAREDQMPCGHQCEKQTEANTGCCRHTGSGHTLLHDHPQVSTGPPDSVFQ